MKRLILLLFLGMVVLTIYAQEEEGPSPWGKHINKWYFGIEAGIKTYNSQGTEYDFIREEAVYYYGYYNRNSQISWMSYVPRFALKAEYRAEGDRVWISSGIDYSFMNSSLGKIAYSYDDSEYFYLMLEQLQDETYYYRIREVGESSHYLGIPLDIRYSPFVPRFFRLYFKLGFDVNFKLASNQRVVFYDDGMADKEEAVLDLFDQANLVYATGTAGVGIQLGKQDRPNIRLEANFPTLVFTPGAFALMEHKLGGGCLISLVLPIKSK